MVDRILNVDLSQKKSFSYDSILNEIALPSFLLSSSHNISMLRHNLKIYSRNNLKRWLNIKNENNFIEFNERGLLININNLMNNNREKNDTIYYNFSHNIYSNEANDLNNFIQKYLVENKYNLSISDDIHKFMNNNIFDDNSINNLFYYACYTKNIEIIKYIQFDLHNYNNDFLKYLLYENYCSEKNFLELLDYLSSINIDVTDNSKLVGMIILQYMNFKSFLNYFDYPLIYDDFYGYGGNNFIEMLLYFHEMDQLNMSKHELLLLICNYPETFMKIVNSGYHNYHQYPDVIKKISDHIKYIPENVVLYSGLDFENHFSLEINLIDAIYNNHYEKINLYLDNTSPDIIMQLFDKILIANSVDEYFIDSKIDDHTRKLILDFIIKNMKTTMHHLFGYILKHHNYLLNLENIIEKKINKIIRKKEFLSQLVKSDFVKTIDWSNKFEMLKKLHTHSPKFLSSEQIINLSNEMGSEFDISETLINNVNYLDSVTFIKLFQLLDWDDQNKYYEKILLEIIDIHFYNNRTDILKIMLENYDGYFIDIIVLGNIIHNLHDNSLDNIIYNIIDCNEYEYGNDMKIVFQGLYKPHHKQLFDKFLSLGCKISDSYLDIYNIINYGKYDDINRIYNYDNPKLEKCIRKKLDDNDIYELLLSNLTFCDNVQKYLGIEIKK